MLPPAQNDNAATLVLLALTAAISRNGATPEVAAFSVVLNLHVSCRTHAIRRTAGLFETTTTTTMTTLLLLVLLYYYYYYYSTLLQYTTTLLLPPLYYYHVVVVVVVRTRASSEAIFIN